MMPLMPWVWNACPPLNPDICGSLLVCLVLHIAFFPTVVSSCGSCITRVQSETSKEDTFHKKGFKLSSCHLSLAFKSD